MAMTMMAMTMMAMATIVIVMIVMIARKERQGVKGSNIHISTSISTSLLAIVINASKSTSTQCGWI